MKFSEKFMQKSLTNNMIVFAAIIVSIPLWVIALELRETNKNK